MIDISRNFLVKNKLNATKVDLFDCFVISQYSNYLGSSHWGMISSKGHTSLIDLNQTEEDLLSSFKSNTRNEVRRAIRDGFFFEKVESIDEFVSFYNDFAKEKNLELITPYKIERFGNQVILFKSGLNGVTMTMHASTLDWDLKQASLLYSASLRFDENVDRKNIGFSNRYLHYMEFLEFKKMGLKKYNFVGVCIDPEQKEKYSIGQFKRGFGGEEYDDVRLQSYPLVIVNKILGILGK